MKITRATLKVSLFIEDREGVLIDRQASIVLGTPNNTELYDIENDELEARFSVLTNEILNGFGGLIN